MFEMHHWLILHKWFVGASAVKNPMLRRWLEAVGNSNLNLIPLPSTINNALGKSMPATAALAQKILRTLEGEVELLVDSLRELDNARARP
jgi:hypothetical protein